MPTEDTSMPAPSGLPALPRLLETKLYKSGQTRGADDDAIYQNRVLRCNTVLVPHKYWNLSRPTKDHAYENGYIALVPPGWYFTHKDPTRRLKAQGLSLGTNALVFYELRSDWAAYPPPTGWKPATSRLAPLGGQYVARVPAITASGGARVALGFTTTELKGAGIRVYEYASSETIKRCRLQLESLFWLCRDAIDEVSKHGMACDAAGARREAILDAAKRRELLDLERLHEKRTISAEGVTVCPLCLDELSAAGFVSFVPQAEGREVHDLAITQISMFHIEELRVGVLNHRPYNVGWGHHHCNVVAKDAGIAETLDWLRELLERNRAWD